MPIVIEAENGEPESPLRVVSGGVVRGEGLSAAQAYILVGELLEDLFSAAEGKSGS